MFRIIGVGFVTAVSALLLKASKPELSFAVTVTGVIVILCFIAERLEQTVGALRILVDSTGVEDGLVKILLKAVGIGYLTEFGAGILSDFGATSVADKVSLAGKLTVLVVSLPVLEGVLKLFTSFMGLL